MNGIHKGHVLAGLLLTAALLAPAPARAAPAPLVVLDARDPSAGTGTWANRGTLGPFRRVGTPYVRPILGVPAVTFDGVYDAYQGPVSVPVLEGAAPRTVEVWAYNPNVESDEETLVTWGKRGGPERTLMAFGWGGHPDWGAATHWAAELSWNGTPRPGRWHLLAYTYDGKTARVYDDGVQKSSRDVALATAPGSTINVGAQNGADGKVEFVQAASLEIASVRVLPAALTAGEIARDFDADAVRFGASRNDVLLGAPAPQPALRTAPDRSIVPLRDALAANLAAFPVAQPALGTRPPRFRAVALSGPLVRVGGHTWTAFSFTTPPGVRRQLRWFLSLPRNVTAWFLTPAEGPVTQTFLDFNRVATAAERAQAPLGLTDAEREVFHQRSEPGTLRPAATYLMYFQCPDGRPDPVRVSMTLAPEGVEPAPEAARAARRRPARVPPAAAPEGAAIQWDALEGLQIGLLTLEPDKDAQGSATGTARVGAIVVNNTRFTLSSLTLLVEILGRQGEEPIVVPFTATEFAGLGDMDKRARRVQTRLPPLSRAWVEDARLRVTAPGAVLPAGGYWMEVVAARGRAAPVRRSSPGATLAAAASLGDLAAARAVVGAHPEAINVPRQGETPLHQAAISGHLAVARLLLDHGARTEARDAAGFTPLMRAVESGRLTLVRLLLARRADPTVQDPGGHALLDLARVAADPPGGSKQIADAVAAAGRGELPPEPAGPPPPWGLKFWHKGGG